MEKSILRNIEIERIKAGLSKEELSRQLGITSKTYLNWIRCVTEIPSGKLLNMKAMFNTSADYLLIQFENDEA